MAFPSTPSNPLLEPLPVPAAQDAQKSEEKQENKPKHFFCAPAAPNASPAAPSHAHRAADNLLEAAQIPSAPTHAQKSEEAMAWTECTPCGRAANTGGTLTDRHSVSYIHWAN